MPTPSLSQIIEQRTWENGQLRQELAYQQRKHEASMLLYTAGCSIFRIKYHKLLMAVQLRSEEGLILVVVF
jgi:hypothetical protein